MLKRFKPQQTKVSPKTGKSGENAAAPAHLRHVIQLGLLVIAALMPFHAFLSVSLGHVFGHQALIQAWKEALLVLLSIAGIALAATDRSAHQRLRQYPMTFGTAFVLIAGLVTLFSRPSLTATVFGAKTDLEFFVAFALAALASTPVFTERIIKITLIAAGIVIGFGILQFTVLPPDFLARFGYGPGTVPPYLVLDPAVKSLRFASTLGGPNQLGAYLILPLSLAATLVWRRKQWWCLIFLIAGGLVIWHTYSRSAWLGALVATAMIMLILTPTRARAAVIAALAVVGGCAGLIMSRLMRLGGNLQYYVLHSSTALHSTRGSDVDHLNSLREGWDMTLANPLGHGLGMAGPATFHQDSSRIIENNYLQIAYETGLVGAFVFIGFVAAVVYRLLGMTRNDLAVATAAAIVGISVAAFVLPVWTDSTTALTVWIAAGSIIGLGRAQELHA